MRLDKLQLAALEATLIAHRDGGREAIPVLAMIDVPAEALERRARAMAEAIGEAAEVRRDAGAPGGGSLPAVRLEGPVCSIDPGPGGADALLARLRGADVPVIARILDGRVVLDPRTMSDEEAAEAAAIARDGRG
jgi:L-seryl-tRNA(Ser) seleniumtransferase